MEINMYTFSEDLYTEVKTVKSTITYVEVSAENQVNYDTLQKFMACIKMYDGKTWKETTISDVRNVQETIDRMMDEWKRNIDNNIEESCSIEKQKEAFRHKKNLFKTIPGKSGRVYHYGDRNITHVPIFMKQNMCKDFAKELEKKHKEGFFCRYEDCYSSISIIDSNGNDYLYDEQKVKMSLNKEKKELCSITGSYFDEIAGQKTEWQSEIGRI